jgi:hypothetical protein
VWSPKGTRLSISPFVAIFLERWLCVLNRRKPVEYAEILDSSAPTIGCLPVDHERHVPRHTKRR